jgi:hypothetical protein
MKETQARHHQKTRGLIPVFSHIRRVATVLVTAYPTLIQARAAFLTMRKFPILIVGVLSEHKFDLRLILATLAPVAWGLHRAPLTFATNQFSVRRGHFNVSPSLSKMLFPSSLITFRSTLIRACQLPDPVCHTRRMITSFMKAC